MADRQVRNQRMVYNRRPTAPPRSAGPRINYDALRSLRGVFILLLALFGLWSIFAIRQIKVEGNQAVTATEIETLAHASFDRHPFSSNLITLNLADLADELPAANKQISSVEVKRQWPGTVVLDVAEHKAVLGWKSGVEQFVLDNEGTVIAAVVGPMPAVPIVTDTTNLPVKVGDKVVPARFVEFCTTLSQELHQRFGLQLTGFQVAETTSEVIVNTNRGYFLKFDTTRPAEDEMGDLNLVFATLTKQHKNPTQYIDLRIAGRAYYK